MRHRLLLWGGLGAAAALLAAGGAWILSLPPARAATAQPPIAEAEAQATLAALKPTRRARPVIAVIGINDATETTDYLMPYGILKRADVAEVVALATGPGPVRLYPALAVQPDGTIADFDARHPEGADYVIVPAMSREDDPAALQWIRAQKAKGATIIGVCVGATVVANAGLLDGRRATSHWWVLNRMRKAHPSLRYVADRRIVVDDGVATTTGISASMPMSLTLIEAIGGRAKAEAVARDLGLAHWDARHDSAAFRFSRPFALTVLGNALPVWNRERLGIALAPGVDEVALALVADAWSRTFRSRALTYAATTDPLQTRSGLRILPDAAADDRPRIQAAPSLPGRRPAEALDQALAAIGARYGAHTADAVAMQLEYPRPAAT
jgi:transcriptional regulator GlxA family with amidase domain